MMGISLGCWENSYCLDSLISSTNGNTTNTKEKIKQEIEKLSEQELQQVSALIEVLKEKKDRRTKSLKLRDFGGKLDHTNIRDIAYE